MDRLNGYSYGSAGITIGMSYFSFQTIGILIGIFTTILLTAVTIFVKIKAYKENKEKFEADMKENELRIKLLKAKLENENSNKSGEHSSSMRDDSDIDDSLSVRSFKRYKDE